MKEMNSSDRPPKVLYYSHSGDVSGAEISLLLTIENVQGVEALLVAPEGELLQRARDKGMRIYPVRSHRARMTRNPLNLARGVIGTVMAGIRLRKLVGLESPDIVHANSIRAGLIAIIATLYSNVKLIWHIRDNLPNNLVGRGIRYLAEHTVDHLFVISNAIRCNFSTSQQLQRKTTVVYNGMNVELPSGDGTLRDELGAGKNTFVVAVVGQIAPWKRQSDAISAFAKFSRVTSDSELWIVGSPKFRQENEVYYESIKSMAESSEVRGRVRFLGFRQDVMNVMNAIDVLLVPSENEPFGRVVIEAMLAGKPVIGTRGGGIPEIVVDGETGFMVDLGDTSAISEFLEWIYNSDSLRKMMGIRGQQRCIDQFSIERTCRNIEEEYRNLINTPERRVLHVETKASRLSS